MLTEMDASKDTASTDFLQYQLRDSSSSQNGSFTYDDCKKTTDLEVELDRTRLGDMPPLVIGIVCVVVDIITLLFYGALVSTFQYSPYVLAHVVITMTFILPGLFWLNYKIHSILFAIYLLFMDLGKLKRNGKYYSGMEVPDVKVENKLYPNITIQIPVYKESLAETLTPTIEHCLREARRYQDETNSLCNVVICDDGLNVIDKQSHDERVAFYSQRGLGYTARPHPSRLVRNGRFKKAGNLNFSMNLSELVLQSNGNNAMETGNSESTNAAREKLNELVGKGTLYGGKIDFGEYILLIDSDTRLPDQPKDQSGCIKRLAKEMMFDGDKILYIQCYTGPYMSIKSAAEKSIFHHTCNIYNSILVGCASNALAPLVGHNAFLNVKAMAAGAEEEAPTEGHVYRNKLYWAEDRISEDFTLMMRGTQAGYHGRYATHAGIFLEGVSFSYLTEYLKIAKFAFGAAELLYNPITQWCSKGVLSRDMSSFMKSTEVEWYNKMHMLAYVLTFVAFGVSPWAILYNLFYCEQMLQILPVAMMPVSMLWEGLFVWIIFNSTLQYTFGAFRMGYNPWNLLKQSLRESLCLTCIYGSVGVKMFIMFVVHFFNLNMSFGATLKDDKRVTLWDWVKTTPYETAAYLAFALAAAMKLMYYTAPENVGLVLYFGCTPLIWTFVLFWTGPLFFEICTRKTDKTATPAYNHRDKKFNDKYNHNIPSTGAFQAAVYYDKLSASSSKKTVDEEKPATTRGRSNTGTSTETYDSAGGRLSRASSGQWNVRDSVGLRDSTSSALRISQGSNLDSEDPTVRTPAKITTLSEASLKAQRIAQGIVGGSQRRVNFGPDQILNA